MKVRAAVCVLAMAAAACGPGKEDKPTVTLPIGVAIDKTGSAATPSWEQSINLALKHANAGLKASGNSKLGNIQFELHVTDTQNLTSSAPQRVSDLVKQEGVKAVIIQQAPISVAVNQLNYDPDASKHLDVPLICGNCVLPALNNATLTDPDPVKQAAYRDADNWFFRSAMTNAKDAEILVRILMATNNGDLNNDGKFKISLYSSTDTALNAFRNNMEKAAKAAREDAIVEKGVQFPFNLDVNTYNFSADVAKLVDDRNEDTGAQDAFPDALVELSPSGISAAVTKAYKTRGETIRFLHNVNFRNLNTLDVLGDQANGQEGTSPEVVADSDSGRAFAEALKGETGNEPAVQDSNFYDATMATFLATLVAVKDLDDPTAVTGAQIRDALLKISDPAGTPIPAGAEGFKTAVGLIAEGKPINYDGASGPMDFDAVGDVKGRIVHWTVENKKFVDVTRYDCVADPSCPAVQ